MSAIYGKANPEECFATLNAAFEAGITLFDTADMYGHGANEVLLRAALRPFRSRVNIATKFGNLRRDDGSRVINGRPEYVRSACEASLRRLGVDTIDLYYQHRVDPNVPIEETVGAMADLVRQGKVRFLGLSEAAPETIRRAHAVHPISAVQTECSLWSRDVEEDILPCVRELGIGFVAYSPLGRGFLSGRFQKQTDFAKDDFRPQMPRFQGENLEGNLKLLTRLQELAESRGMSSAQLALAWLMNRHPDIVPIPGTTRRANLLQNIEAASVSLSAADLQEIESCFPSGGIQGARYHAAGLASLDR